MKRAMLGAALALAVTTSAGAEPDFAGLGLTAYQPPKEAPAFSLPDLDGRTRTLEQQRGKVLLLFFWATW
jgi:cytochrome oxidase Cu insertion factor (SCO1/SenC/PrrC family)